MERDELRTKASPAFCSDSLCSISHSRHRNHHSTLLGFPLPSYAHCGSVSTGRFCQQASSLVSHPYIVQNPEQNKIDGVSLCLIQVNLFAFKEINHFCPRDCKLCTCRSTPLRLHLQGYSNSFPTLTTVFHRPGSVPVRFPPLPPALDTPCSLIVLPKPSPAVTWMIKCTHSWNSFHVRALVFFFF